MGKGGYKKRGGTGTRAKGPLGLLSGLLALLPLPSTKPRTFTASKIRGRRGKQGNWRSLSIPSTKEMDYMMGLGCVTSYPTVRARRQQ